MSFKLGEGRKAFNITENELRYSMENTKSCCEAARFLNISYDTFKKYAKMYIDKDSGKTLFEIHKNQRGKGIKKSGPRMRGRYGLLDILEGKYPEYRAHNLKGRLLRNSVFEEKCENCGFEERRITDYVVPLLLDWIDSDRTNHKRDNLRMLCYNCYFVLVGNPIGNKPKNWHGY